MTTLAGSAVLLMVLAGCGKTPVTPGSGPTEGPSRAESTAPAEPAPETRTDFPADAKPVAESQLDTDALPEQQPAKVRMKGNTLHISAQEGGCDQVSAEVSEQTASQVVVTVVLTKPAGSPMCTMDIRNRVLAVDLDEPLGERALVLEYEERVG